VGWEARIAERRRAEAEGERARADAQAAQAVRERNRAEENARIADGHRMDAEAQRREAEAERQQAETLFGGVRDLTNSMLFDVTSQIAELQGATAARESLVTKGVAYLERLQKDPRATPELRRDLAAAYLKIGDLQGRTVHPNIGDPQASFNSYARSVELLEPLYRANPHDPKLAHLMIQAYKMRGWMQQDRIAGVADCNRAVAIAEGRVAADPKNLEARHDLASSLAAAPLNSEPTTTRARDLFEGLLRDGAKDPEIRRELAWQYRNLGSFALDRDPHKAIDLYTTSLEQFAGLATEYPSNAVYQREHAVAQSAFVNPLLALNRNKEAIDYSRRALALIRQVVRGDSRNVSFRLDLIQFEYTLAVLLGMESDSQEALAGMKQGAAEADQLAIDTPANPDYRFVSASIDRQVGSLAAVAGDRKTSLEYRRKSESQMEQLVLSYPAREDYRSGLGEARIEVGKSLGESGDRRGATEKYRQGLAEFQRLTAGKNHSGSGWGLEAAAHSSIATGLEALGDLKGEREELRQAKEIYEQMLAVEKNRDEHRAKLSDVHLSLAILDLREQDWKAAIDDAHRALPYREERYKANRSSQDRLESLASPLRALGDAYAGAGDSRKEIEIRRRLADLREHAASVEPQDPARTNMQMVSLTKLASVASNAGDRQAFLEATRRMIDVLGRKVIPALEEQARTDQGKRVTLITTYRDLAQHEQNTRDLSGAIENLQKALRLEVANPSDNAAFWDAAGLQQNRIASLQLRVGQPDEARESLRSALKWYERSQQLAEPGSKNLGRSNCRLGFVHEQLGDLNEALRFWRVALAAAESGDENEPIKEIRRSQVARLEWLIEGRKGGRLFREQAAAGWRNLALDRQRVLSPIALQIEAVEKALELERSLAAEDPRVEMEVALGSDLQLLASIHGEQANWSDGAARARELEKQHSALGESRRVFTQLEKAGTLPPEHSGTLAALDKSISAVESQISGMGAQP
jgi:tetratricopeptide (TPR) repeat protein